MAFVITALGCIGIGAIVGATSIGGFLLVPLLTLALNMSPGAAVGTTLVAFVPSSIIGTWLYARQRQVDFRIGIGLALLSVPGVLLGSILAGVITERQAAIGLSALLVVVGLYIRQQSRHLKEQEICRSDDVDVVLATPAKEQGLSLVYATPGRMLTIICAAIIAGISAVLAGVGGALILVPVLVSLGVQPRRTIGTGQLITLLISSAGASAFFITGRLDSSSTIVITLLYSAGLVLGAVFVCRLNNRYLRVVVAFLCFISAVLLPILK